MSTNGGSPHPGKPIFGFVLFGGPLSGARVRDIRLANELAARGYRVHVWWAVDRHLSAPLRADVTQHWLFHGLRYIAPRGSGACDMIGRLGRRIFREKNYDRFVQKRPWVLNGVMDRFTRRVCDSVEADRRLVRRFARSLSRTGVTHMLPMLAVLCPWVAAAIPLVDHRVRYLVTFQGYELYSSFARAAGLERRLLDRLGEAVKRSDWPAIAVSADYLDRVVEDVGIPRQSLRAIPPGIPSEFPVDADGAAALVAARFPEFRPGVPLVTYLGRQDAEKGIDLLLYAAAMLRRDGLRFQVAVCGPTLFGNIYLRVCKQLAENLRCPVLWANQVSDELRSALFSASRFIVYPSIHREPFGMVAAEALAHGTPALVPDYGGIAGAIEAEGEVGGLRFGVWDSADLAAQMRRLLTDDALHRRLSAAGPGIAAYYSVSNMADRVLDHLGVIGTGAPRRPALGQPTAKA